MAKKNKESAEDKLINVQLQQLAAQVANWAAMLDFQKERFRLLELPQFQQGLQLDVDKFAWQKAQDTWERAYQESLLTGTYNGQPTTQWLMDQARMTGSYNGERTLEGKLTDAQIQDMHDKMRLANDQFLAATTGYFNGQKTFDREKFEAAQGLEGWKFISTLTGPQNAFKQARAIASMPGGVSQQMAAFAGQYMLPSGGAVGSGGARGAFGQLNDLMMQGGGAGAYGMGGGGAPGSPGGSGFWGTAPPGSPGGPPVTMPTGTMPLSEGIPGRGFAPGQWNQATQAAAAEWNRLNPGYEADGSQRGYRILWGDPNAQQRGTFVNADEAAAWDAVHRQNPVGIPNNLMTPVDSTGGRPIGVPEGYSYQPPGVQAPPNAWNYSQDASGGVGAYPPGVVSPAQTSDISTAAPVNPASVAPMLNQPYQYQAGVIQTPAGQGVTPLPSQINAQNYNNAYEYQKELLWAEYEDQGWDKGLAQESYLRSLPQYKSPTKGAYAF